MNEVAKMIWSALGAAVGWVVGEFSPAFPLVVVMVVFICADAWTAWKLDKRAHKTYPDRAKRHEAKFTSFAFGKVVTQTIPNRLALIFLAYLVEHWVAIHVTLPLSYVVTGVICFEQAWSMLENEASCRPDSESRFWRMLQRVLIDKTERHLDVTLDEFKDEKKEEADEAL